MKTITKLLVGIIFIYSCQRTESRKIIMGEFIENHRTTFEKSDLLRFNYDPRVKFENYFDSVSYRIFRRPDNKLMISMWTDRESLDTTDKTQNFIANYIDFIVENEAEIRKNGINRIEWLDKKDNQIVLLGDSGKSYTIPNDIFDFDPINYFANLEHLIDSFGILEINRYDNYIQLIFDSENSLYYFPNSLDKDSVDKKLEKIDKKWYISKEKNNTDYQ